VARFRYTARDEQGRRVHGTVEATTEVGARNTLVMQRLEVLSLRERKAFREIEVVESRVDPTDIAAFSRQLAAFLRAGIPILDGIETIAQEVRDRTLRRMLAEIGEELRSGRSFADSIDRFAKQLPSYYPGIVRSAEFAGNLPEVLEHLAEYIDRDQKTRRRVRSALTYPTILLVLSIVTVVILVGFVLPKFTEFFASFDAKMPATTQLLIDLGDLVSNNALVLAVAVALVVIVVTYFARGHRSIGARHWLLLHIPFVRDVVQAAVIERFCRILGAMLRTGVPISDGLVAAINSCDNRVWERKLLVAAERTLRGEGLAGPLGDTGLFPGTVLQIVRVGEETGTLAHQLTVAADYYADELTVRLERLTTVFEPAVVLFMGVVVGFVAVALVSAMYGIYSQTDFGGGGP